MAWLIIVIVLAAIIAPIVYLLPSKRDRSLAALRTEARRAGLVVEVTQVPKVDAAAEERVSSGGRARTASVDCAAYRLPLPVALDTAPAWLLLRSERENRYVDGWTTLSPPRRLPTPQAAYWQEIEAVLSALPGGCIAVETAPEGITWFGRERIGDAAPDAVVAAIRDGLEAIHAAHSKLHETAPAGDR